MCALLTFCSANLLANSITYNFDHTQGGIHTMGGAPAPWLTAAFSDNGNGTVQLTLAGLGLPDGEYVGGWYFNLNPALNAASLAFTRAGSSGSFTSPVIRTGTDAFKPDHDGKYDLLLSFDTSGDAASRFSAGDSVTFNITGIAGLTADDFVFVNTPAAGHAPFYASAYLEALGESAVIEDVTKDSVPDGGLTVLLLGFGLMATEVLRRKLQWLRG